MRVETTTDLQGNVRPLLDGYDGAERRAILEHKYFLGIEMGFDPGLQCAVASWEAHYALLWRKRRQKADCDAQLAEISKHRVLLIEREGRDVCWEAAARDWISRHAASWRRRRDCSGVYSAEGLLTE